VSEDDTALVRLVDELEARADSYVTRDEVEAAAPGYDLASAIADGVLLVDYRTRLDCTQVTLCRLNRRHPLVVRLTAW
jgi:hypothetical protein